MKALSENIRDISDAETIIYWFENDIKYIYNNKMYWY